MRFPRNWCSLQTGVCEFARRAALQTLLVRVNSPGAVHENGVIVDDVGVSGRLLTLQVSDDSKVDLSPLEAVVLAKRYKTISAKIRSLLDVLRWKFPMQKVPLADFVEALTTADLQVMLMDVLRGIGFGVEAVLDAEFKALREDAGPKKIVEEHLRWPDAKGLTTHEMAASNVSIMQGVREVLQNAKQISFATDGARVGMKSRQDTLWVLPSNFAAWGPPTVFMAVIVDN